MSLITPLLIVGIAVLVTPLLTRLMGRNSGWVLAALYLVATATLAPVTRDVLAGESPAWSIEWLPELGVELALRADGLGLVFGYIALVIGAVVFCYSTRYLEPGRQLSFYLVMTLFTFAMLGLVFAADLVLLFICWELTSLASFLLIARSGVSGEGASMRTLLVTFVGGVFLLIAVVSVWLRVGTTDLQVVFSSEVWAQDPGFTALIAVLVAIAAFTKSAQFPFHVWLPDAMAAITPVSAYLHAAAVVKAGIFLLLRFSPLFAGVVAWNAMLLIAGLITSCIGAWFAIQQTDLKKLMAYSTVSQLGLIVATIGIGSEAALTAAVLHTIAHALFKSGLFMMVGVVDHSAHTRDLRRLPPKLYRKLPVSFAITILGCASMAGIPPMLGFVSKEAILAALYEAPQASWVGWTSFLVIAAGAVLTFTYCTKIVFGTFVDGTETDRPVTSPSPIMVITAGLPIVVSLPLGFAVGVFDPIVSAATAAATGIGDVSTHLLLWHGVNAPLIASAVVIAIGCLIIVVRRPVFAAMERHPFPFTGADVIAAIVKGLVKVGTLTDKLVGADQATRHQIPILLSLAAIGIGGTIVVSDDLPAQIAGMNRIIDLLLLGLIALAVVCVCISRSRLAATVSLSAVGILATVQILSLGAPDVAMTQLLVESLSIIVIMLVLQKLPLKFPKRGIHGRRVTLTIAMFVGAGVAALTWALNGRRGRSELAEYFLANTYEITGGHNIVNVILVEFRALDTLGELSVLGMAGVAIVAILSTVRDKHLDPAALEAAMAPEPKLALRSDPASTAYRAINVAWPNAVGLQLMQRVAVPVLLLIAVLLFWRGHNEPGGGFNAALVVSAIVALMYLSTSRDRQIGPPKLPLFLIGGGMVTAVVSGLLGLLGPGSFLEPIYGYLFDIHLSTSMIFDAGVFAAVVGMIMVSFNLLGTSNHSIKAGESTRERVDEALEGELPGPMDTVRGERAKRVAPRSTFLAEGEQPSELGR